MRNLIKLGILFALGLACGWASAQTLYVYPPGPLAAPIGTDVSVTAIVTGVNDKTVAWTSDAGTIVGTNPCVANEPCTAAIRGAATGAVHLTATSSANSSVHQTVTVNFTGSPTPVSTHPRFLLTAAQVAGLQAKSSAGNTQYQAVLSVANGYYATDNAIWSWSCLGGSGAPSGTLDPGFMERHAQYYALLSMVAPTSGERDQWGCRGRDVWTWMMAKMAAGTWMPGEDEWRSEAPRFAYTTDWLMWGNYLSSADQTLARQYVVAMLKYSLGGPLPGWVPPNGPYNSSSEFITGISYLRTMGNNYSEARALYLAALPLTFNDDTTDDPPLANTCTATRYQVCPDWTAGSMHAYHSYFTGAILYDTYALLEDPNVSWQAYQARYGNLPTIPQCHNWQGDSEIGPGLVPCFGNGRGGESSEGSGYGYSVGSVREAINALQSAGYNDPLVDGPQVSLIYSSWWDLRDLSTLEFLTGQKAKNGNLAGTSPAYNWINTGDANTYGLDPHYLGAEAAMLVSDWFTGRTDRWNMLLWPLLNVAFGGPDGTALGCSNYCGFVPELTNDFAFGISIDAYLALPGSDPTVTPPADPRGSIPRDVFNGSLNQHQMVRSGFTNSDSLLSYTCGNALIDHEHPTCGRFEIYSGNEWITKGRNAFDDYNHLMVSATQSNMLSVMNTGTTCNDIGTCPYAYSATQGGDWWHGTQQGSVSVLHSELPAYAADVADMTPIYNTWGDYNGVTKAARSLLYVRSQHQVVWYDRADTGSTPLAKAVYLNTTGTPTVTGSQASWLTQSGAQKAVMTNLLGGTLSNIGLAAGNSEQAGDWEVASTLKVAPASNVASKQFLNVLEWGASSFTPSACTLVQSTAGDSFDGAKIGSSLTMFMRSWPAAFAGVTYPASGATTHYVSDLAPNTSYPISGTGAPASATTDSAGVLAFAAAGTGSITVGTGSPPPPVPSPTTTGAFGGPSSIGGTWTVQ